MRRLIQSIMLICAASPAVAQEPRILPNSLDLPLLAGDRILPGGTEDFVQLSVPRGLGNAAPPYIEQLRAMGWVVTQTHKSEAHVRRGEVCFLVTGGLIITADNGRPPDPYVEVAFQKYPCVSG